jgi:hypothetical protein
MDTSTTSAVVDDAARDRVTVTGPDAARYLHSQLAQDVEGLEVGATRWTFVLEPNGKVHTLARITRLDDHSFVLDTDAGFGPPLVARLERFKIRVDATIDVAEATAPEPSPETERARIAAGWPRMGTEITTGDTIPAATGLVPIAVDLRKGCFPGQELVERMDSRGADAPRVLRVIDVAAGTVAGDPILDAAGAEVGVLTSVAGPVGLGYVRRGADVGRSPAHVG